APIGSSNGRIIGVVSVHIVSRRREKHDIMAPTSDIQATDDQWLRIHVARSGSRKEQPECIHVDVLKGQRSFRRIKAAAAIIALLSRNVYGRWRGGGQHSQQANQTDLGWFHRS